jgi:hypothetical protein
MEKSKRLRDRWKHFHARIGASQKFFVLPNEVAAQEMRQMAVNRTVMARRATQAAGDQPVRAARLATTGS